RFPLPVSSVARSTKKSTVESARLICPTSFSLVPWNACTGIRESNRTWPASVAKVLCAEAGMASNASAEKAAATAATAPKVRNATNNPPRMCGSIVRSSFIDPDSYHVDLGGVERRLRRHLYAESWGRRELVDERTLLRIARYNDQFPRCTGS